MAALEPSSASLASQLRPRFGWRRSLLLGANLAAPPLLLATQFRQLGVVCGAALVHAAYAAAVTRPNCDWFGPVVTRFAPQGKEAWLTIDDGPFGEESVTLAAELERRGAKVTFFVKGRSVLADPAAARAIAAHGHEFGNHTQTHPAAWFWLLPPARLRRELDDCSTALAEAGLPPPRCFRAPVGLKHPRLHPMLADRGLRLIGWSVRAHDGVRCDPSAVMHRVRERISPGAIVLMHEGRARSREAILSVVEDLQARGYALVVPADAQLV